MNRAERVAQQLGMPHGTATNRLRKNILFRLAQQLDLTTCFKCGTLIETVDEFSIEHKEPWEGRDPKLFWDLDNIAFSHHQCNRPHVVSNLNKRKIGPVGTSWCSTCQQFLPLEDFNKRQTRFDGVDFECRACKKARR